MTMETTPIHDRLAAVHEGEELAQRAWSFLARHLNRKENTVNIADFEQDIRNDVQAGMDKAADLYNHLKGVFEQRLPQIAAIQQSPVAQAIEGVFLPPEIEAELTSIVKTYTARFGAPAAPAAPAEPEAPAPASEPLPAQ
jgi:hypothetical protein